MGIAPLIMGMAAKVTSVEDPLSTLTFTKAVNVEESGEQSPGVCSMWTASWNHRSGDRMRPKQDLQADSYRLRPKQDLQAETYTRRTGWDLQADSYRLRPTQDLEAGTYRRRPTDRDLQVQTYTSPTLMSLCIKAAEGLNSGWNPWDVQEPNSHPDLYLYSIRPIVVDDCHNAHLFISPDRIGQSQRHKDVLKGFQLDWLDNAESCMGHQDKSSFSTHWLILEMVTGR